jgi:4-amino-4-deoxy-L-arabinose transferase-like glycosyltransferase
MAPSLLRARAKVWKWVGVGSGRGQKRDQASTFPLAVVAWVACFVIARALGVDADPPAALPNGARSQELWAEGAAKAQEARNWALFGTWQTNPADNYQFWRVQAPVWVYSLAAFLKLFGVKTIVLRMHSIAVGALGFALTLVLGRQGLRRVGWGALGTFLAFSYYYVLYTRAGLIEPMVNLFAAALVLCTYLALSRPIWLVPATWALVLAVFSKMSGLFLLPVLLVGGATASYRARRSGPRVWLPPLAHAAAVLGGVAIYMSSAAYRQRLVWNVAHMAYNKDGHTEVDMERIDFGRVFERLLEPYRYHTALFPLFPVALVLCVPALVRLVRSLSRREALGWDALCALWLASGFASLQLTDSTYVRFYLVLFPPVALLGARGLDVALEWLGPRRALRIVVVVMTLGAFAFINVRQYADWWQKRTYQVRDTNRKVRRLIRHQRAVVIGMWAPWLTFDSRHEFYTVRSYFNVTRPALAKLGVTHLLLRRNDLSGSIFRRHFPHSFDRKRKLAQFRVHRESLTLFELREPLREARSGP